MIKKSKAYSQAITSLEECFMERVLDLPTREGSLQTILNSIVREIPMKHDTMSTIKHMKYAADAQEYRIQRSYLQIEHQPTQFFEECYELPSTAVLPDKSLFKEINNQNLIDEVWWSMQKKIDENFYLFE